MFVLDKFKRVQTMWADLIAPCNHERQYCFEKEL